MSILISNDQDIPVDEEALALLATFILDQEGIDTNAELSIALVNEDEMRRLNFEYRNKDYATDVLSFAFESVEEATSEIPRILGDVVICPAIAEHQAQEYGQSLTEEMALLLTHGILHLLGYDHEQEDEAEEMEARERELLGAYFKKSPDQAPEGSRE